jgi:hypothetical protein
MFQQFEKMRSKVKIIILWGFFYLQAFFHFMTSAILALWTFHLPLCPLFPTQDFV